MAQITVGTGLFVYNRPEHTRLVLESLKQNRITTLYIFADGPRQGGMSPQIEETRRLIHAVDWCETKITEHEQNHGIVGNVTSGIERMFQDNDAAIVLEDDCAVRPDYHAFMVGCLDFYKNDPSIVHVNGYQFPVRADHAGSWDVYRSPHATSWGYGLWKRCWPHFRLNVDDAREYLRTPQARRLLEVVPDFAQRMEMQLSGLVNSFIYRWNFIINRYGGSCISPYRSFVRNIGWDGRGVHCGHSTRYDISDVEWERPLMTDLRLPEHPIDDARMNVQVRKFFRKKPDLLFKAYRQWKLWRRDHGR